VDRLGCGLDDGEMVLLLICVVFGDLFVWNGLVMEYCDWVVFVFCSFGRG